MYFFVIKSTHFVSGAGNVNEIVKYLISVRSSKKIVFLCIAYVAILGMFSGNWGWNCFHVTCTWCFVPSSFSVLGTFHLFFFKSTWLCSISTAV